MEEIKLFRNVGSIKDEQDDDADGVVELKAWTTR